MTKLVKKAFKAAAKVDEAEWFRVHACGCDFNCGNVNFYLIDKQKRVFAIAQMHSSQIEEFIGDVRRAAGLAAANERTGASVN